MDLLWLLYAAGSGAPSCSSLARSAKSSSSLSDCWSPCWDCTRAINVCLSLCEKDAASMIVPSDCASTFRLPVSACRRAELLGATPSMVDSTSAELLRIAENGGLAKNVRYTYKGKLVKFFRVTGNDYAKAVGEFRMQRKYGRRQIGFRVCQLVTFTLTVITIAVGTWALTVYVFDAMQYGFLDEAVPVAVQLRPAIPRLEKA